VIPHVVHVGFKYGDKIKVDDCGIREFRRAWLSLLIARALSSYSFKL